MPFGVPESGTNSRRVKLAVLAGPVTLMVTVFADLPLAPPSSKVNPSGGGQALAVDVFLECLQQLGTSLLLPALHVVDLSTAVDDERGSGVADLETVPYS